MMSNLSERAKALLGDKLPEKGRLISVVWRTATNTRTKSFIYGGAEGECILDSSRTVALNLCDVLEVSWDYVPEQPKDINPLNTQEGGDHYKSMAIQPVEYIHANNMPYLEGNAVKYLSRHRAKGGAQDIRKAIHYCQLILKLEYEEDV